MLRVLEKELRNKVLRELREDFGFCTEALNDSLSVVDVEPDLVERVLPHGGDQELRLGCRGGDGVTLAPDWSIQIT